MGVGAVEVLWFVFTIGLALWVGGAVTGQIMMARARVEGDNLRIVMLTREISWVISHFYIPVGIVAVLAGIGLVVVTGTSLLSWWVVFPVVIYMGIVAMGSFYSLPEYGKLNEMFIERGKNDPETHARLTKAAWVNRIELAIVTIGLFGIIVGVLGT